MSGSCKFWGLKMEKVEWGLGEREKKNINVGISFPRIFGEEPILEEVIIKLKFVEGQLDSS